MIVPKNADSPATGAGCAAVLARADLAAYPTFAALRDGWAGPALPFVYMGITIPGHQLARKM